jgi:Chitin recognition protein
MIAQLKAIGTTYISWAPQCIDYHLTANIIRNSAIDFLFVQFYNTPYCSALSYINNPSTSGFTSSFNEYADSKPGIKVFIGLPASPEGANPGNYLDVAQVSTLLNSFGSNVAFGGISLWEATVSQENRICNMDYATWMKMLLLRNPFVAASNLGQTCSAGSAIVGLPTAIPSLPLATISAVLTMTTLTRTVPVPSSPVPPPGVLSPDGSCGGLVGHVCGNNLCCSPYGFCGSTSAYCGLGCQSSFGTCANSGHINPIPSISFDAPMHAASSPAPKLVPAGPLSPDGSCGGPNGYTCLGDGFSVCCSKWGWCGLGPAYCGPGNCQAAFGACL